MFLTPAGNTARNPTRRRHLQQLRHRQRHLPRRRLLLQPQQLHRLLPRRRHQQLHLLRVRPQLPRLHLHRLLLPGLARHHGLAQDQEVALLQHRARSFFSMKKRRTAQLRHQVASTRRISVSAFFNPRASIALFVCAAAACSVLAGARLAFFRPEAQTNVSHRTLTFAERVAYQRAIEEVYWRHRIWPRSRGERPDPKPSLDALMSQAQIEQKVEDYLRNSQPLEDYWQRPITVEQLQAEMDRMAQHTKQPEVLREIFAALGNDPFVIAECLARPVLAERVITELYAHDQRFHGELKRRAEADLRTHPSVREMKQTSGMYTEMEWIKSDGTPDQDKGGSASPEDDAKANAQRRGAEDGITLNSR